MDFEAGTGGTMRDDWRDATVAGDGLAIDRLLADGLDVDGRDRHGQTALMLASLHGQDAMVRLLLEKGADRDVTAKYGLSALMLAVINRHAGIARQLVDAGADTLIRGSGAPGFLGKTAVDLADGEGLTDLAAYIARAEGRES